MSGKLMMMDEMLELVRNSWTNPANGGAGDGQGHA